MSPNPTRGELFAAGVILMHLFCEINEIAAPSVLTEVEVPVVSKVSRCAFYRPVLQLASGEIRNHVIAVHVARCSSVGRAGQAWSWPGHQVDRTPYGVIQHELGHHVDLLVGGPVTPRSWQGNLSKEVMDKTREKPLTGYAPDPAEWFAEMFRLFVTNPTLLYGLRPKTYLELAGRFTPVVNDSWDIVLRDAPDRTRDLCRRRVGA